MQKKILQKPDSEPLTMDLETAKARYQIGAHTLVRIAKEAGAIRKFGKVRLFVRPILDDFIIGN